jgi:hypothetical protein
MFILNLLFSSLYINVQRAHSGVFMPKLILTTTVYVTRDAIKYLCACDGTVHNTVGINVMYEHLL